MKASLAEISQTLRDSIEFLAGPLPTDFDVDLRRSEFSDFQSGVAFSLAKPLRQSPRQIADQLASTLTAKEEWLTAEASGPGFINLSVSKAWLEAAVQAEQHRDPSGNAYQQTAVVDYSSPNVAKEMHVGHLRTTIIGDAISKLLEAVGTTVIRQNHVGDWGTPFGMLIEHLIDVGEESAEAKLLETQPNRFYQAAREKFDSSAEFAERSRQRVVALQAGDEPTLLQWRMLTELSRHYFERIYQQLEVSLSAEHLAGESIYNDMLAGLTQELLDAGIAVISRGAVCVFLDGYLGREGEPLPLIVRKSDGGYGYAATDLAAVRYRTEVLKADHLIYVVGAAQELHLQMIEETARKAGWLTEQVQFSHVKVGSVLGSDGKILRTRSGDSQKLADLVEEALTRANRAVEQSRPELPAEVQHKIGQQVGIGAIKYADLSIGHASDYTFDLERMLAFTGNTAPYIQYSAARIQAMLRKAAEAGSSFQETGLDLTEPQERSLAIALLNYSHIVEQSAQTLQPHRLANCLFELAQAFSSFYDHCPVFTAASEHSRDARLKLCQLTLGVLSSGLGLLGIRTPEQM
ncbi:arginine--tRNA ligase [Psychromicrobium lacuslunae]|uniref:Arginine--tRNA ligase n=1 Tax=Psychromicrobium lacuslunae TaxID=1618207 RepID=A0A0D4C1Q5_9MICC|nr:arginine--tRNA ligase [Psychromicrobium lacuslunae]AJT42340.1 arginyl-tRNA synthetase [Psychromicrobium lacuslunae]